MDVDKKRVVKSILKFIKDELAGTSLDGEQKESLDVARQCLETTYETSSESLTDVDDITVHFQKKPDVPVSHFESEVLAHFYMRRNLLIIKK